MRVTTAQTVFLALALQLGCAPLPDDGAPGKTTPAAEAPPFEDYGDVKRDVASKEQSLTTQPWQPSNQFNEAYRGSNFYAATTPGWFAYQMTSPNTEYQINGVVRSGDNTTFSHTYVSWSMTIAGTTNACVVNGCTFWLCFENTSRGWGTCTQVLGQGANSHTMELHGTTTFFAGLNLGAYEFGRWTLATTTFPYWPWTATITDFTVTAYNTF
jgi:hypothetical protein